VPRCDNALWLHCLSVCLFVCLLIYSAEKLVLQFITTCKTETSSSQHRQLVGEEEGKSSLAWRFWKIGQLLYGSLVFMQINSISTLPQSHDTDKISSSLSPASDCARRKRFPLDQASNQDQANVSKAKAYFGHCENNFSRGHRDETRFRDFFGKLRFVSLTSRSAISVLDFSIGFGEGRNVCWLNTYSQITMTRHHSPMTPSAHSLQTEFQLLTLREMMMMMMGRRESKEERNSPLTSLNIYTHHELDKPNNQPKKWTSKQKSKIIMTLRLNYSLLFGIHRR